MVHESYNIANAVAVLQATQTFKRIASWCSAQLTRHNMSHEDTVENPFLKYATLFDTNDEVNAYYYIRRIRDIRNILTNRAVKRSIYAYVESLPCILNCTNFR